MAMTNKEQKLRMMANKEIKKLQWVITILNFFGG
jgi:hypothetical protein